MAPARRVLGVYLPILALTLIHWAYRAADGKDRENGRLTVSGLVPGDQVAIPSLSVDPTQKDPSSGDCQLLVAVDSACLHSRVAANRWAAKGGEEAWPVIWMVENEDTRSFFASLVPGRDSVQVGPDEIGFLDLNAVPAGFLVRPDQRVARVWPFTGRESGVDLEDWCQRRPFKPLPNLTGM